MEIITFQRIAKLAASELQSASIQKLFSSFFQGFQSFPQKFYVFKIIKFILMLQYFSLGAK